MGHAQSKRKKRSQTRLRRKIEHVTHEQTRSSWSAGANGSPRARNFNPGRKSVQKSARWREPSPEKLETLERRQRDAANRTKRSRSRSQQSRSRSPKRQSQSRANLNESDSNLRNPKMQHYRKEISRENLKMRNAETTRGRNFSRRSGTWFCVVRCRSEPPLGNHHNKAARVDHLPPRKSASSSPARRVRRELESTPMYQNGLQHFVNQRKQKVQKSEFAEKTPGRVRTSAREEHELDRSFQASHGRPENVINDEIGISFEQVEPKLLRLFGSSAKSGPIPQTNRVAPRALRRSFPNLASRKEPNELAPKRNNNFISRTAKDKSVSESRLQKLAAQHFPKPPIPPRKQKLSDLAHLVQQSSPKLPSNANQHQHTNRNNQNYNYGSVETLSSFSSQSGSYHLPSSANFSTLPDRSLAESPHALHIDSDFEKYSEDGSADALYIRTIPQTPPLTVEAAYRRNDQPTATVPSSPETGKKNLLWSNPSPFGSQPLQKVIRSVQAPIQKPQNLHWPPLKTDSHEKRDRITSRAPPVPRRPPQMSHQLERKSDEISVSPLRLPVSPQERPRSAVQDRVYRDILFDNTERTSFPIKSGLSKTLRPSIEDLVSILAEPIPPHNRKSQRTSHSHRSLHETSQSEEILINELKTEKKPRPGILKNANTTSSSRVVEVLYHEPRSRKTDQERGNNRGRAEHPPIFLGEDDFGNNWIDLTQPATTLYLNDY